MKFLEHCEIDRNLSPNTIKMYDFYLADFRNFLCKLLKRDRLHLSDLNSDHIKKYRIYLNRKPVKGKFNENYKIATQKSFLVCLRSFLKYLIVKLNYYF